MMRNKYEHILNDFEIHYPELYKRSVDWWASGRMSITVVLDDGARYEYDNIDSSIRRIRTTRDEVTDDILTKEIGANLRKFMPVMGITQNELCDKIGINPALLSRYIHGKSSPSAIKLYRIAKAIGCTMDELFDGTYFD